MSWESTAEYYRLLNEGVRKRLGGLHSAECLVYSVDFAHIEALQVNGEWEEAGAQLAAAARTLEGAGAELLLLCTHTMHIVPEPDDRQLVHRVIYNELCVGVVSDSSRRAYLEVIDRLAEAGAQGVILGCTEIELLVDQSNTDVALFPTTTLHVEAALDIALS
jgi:aspartate racemase